MKICVCGWYFRPQLMRSVAASGYDAFVVKHREGDTQGIDSELYDNKGLEFGAYRQYVDSHWDGVSDVLFMHDDANVIDPVVFPEIASLDYMGVEQAYIFQDETHEMVNGGAHGRGIWISGTTLALIATDFPADMENTGTNVGLTAQQGILKFHKRITACGSNTGVIAIVPNIVFAHRGRVHEQMFVYRKTGQVPGGLVNASQ